MRQRIGGHSGRPRPATVDALRMLPGRALREPWSIAQQENPRVAAALIIDAPEKAEAGVRGEPLIVRGGPRERLGATARIKPKFGANGSLPAAYVEVLERSARPQQRAYQLVRSVPTSFDVDGWRLAANAVRLVAAKAIRRAHRQPYFVSLYESLADALQRRRGLFGLEGREHTAQVDQERREWREWRFRWGEEDRERLAEARTRCARSANPTSFCRLCFVRRRWSLASIFRR